MIACTCSFRVRQNGHVKIYYSARLAIVDQVTNISLE